MGPIPVDGFCVFLCGLPGGLTSRSGKRRWFSTCLAAHLGTLTRAACDEEPLKVHQRIIQHIASCTLTLKHGACADSGPGVFNDFDFNHSSLICLKLWCREDFVVLPLIRNGVFVPHYARKLFIDHIIEFYWAK